MTDRNLEFPDGFDECAQWEVQSKGFFEHAVVRFGDVAVPVTFFDPVRLRQEVLSETYAGRAFSVKRLLVVPKVTVEQMRTAVADAPAELLEDGGLRMTSRTTISLSNDHWLVLFDLIARLNEAEGLVWEDQAEQRALWDLEATLESVLPDVVARDYGDRLTNARDRLRDATADRNDAGGS